jgi:cell division septation protein DedD
MEGRTLYLLLTLMLLTGVVVFYLGVVTGKALRDPNATVSLSAEMRAPADPAAPASAAGQQGLAFNEALRAKEPSIEGLRVEQEGVTQRTEDLVSRVQKQLELEEVKPGDAAPAAAPAKPPAAAQAPAAAPAPARSAPAPAPPATASTADEGLFTVQVFSSTHQDNARALAERLKGMGFAAYLNRFQDANNQVWFRVRVGRTSRGEAETLSARLRSEANLKNPQVRKL